MINSNDFLQHELKRMFETRLKDKPKTVPNIFAAATEIADFLDITLVVHEEGIDVFVQSGGSNLNG